MFPQYPFKSQIRVGAVQLSPAGICEPHSGGVETQILKVPNSAFTLVAQTRIYTYELGVKPERSNVNAPEL